MKSPRRKNSQKDLRQQLGQLEAKWKRALADYQNLEKRINANQSQFVKLATAALIDRFLSVLDNLQAAAAHLKDPGLDLVVTQFQDIILSEGIEEIKAQGQPFDPHTMDCADIVPGKKNLVVKIIQKGYRLNDNVLRPAKVEVGSGKQK
jgi:molecular chaperone GrpE